MLVVVPTEEQQAACEMFAGGGDLALVAGAGTGKTATLVLMAATTRRHGMYLAYNRAIANDARRRFGPNVTCSTAHSVAYRATGKQYRERLNTSARIPGPQAARLLGITRDLGIGSATITCAHQARLVMGMIRRFCYSNDDEVMARHMEPVNGLDVRGQDYLAGVLRPYAVRGWEDICDPRGRLRFEHDHYLKMWALTRPVLIADFVLLDEAQDTNPVLEEIFLSQHAQRVCVGDPAQQIYAWRYARDVMTGFPAAHLCLTKLFRFGPRIAAVANRWLALASSSMRLTGSAGVASRVGRVRFADAVLCRGNADAMSEVLGFLASGVPVALTGGGEALRSLATAAAELQSGSRTSHPELFLFQSWGQVQEYAEQDAAGQDLRAMVRLVDTHGPTVIIDAVNRLSAEGHARVTVSTAHKAKGLEWGSVRIGPGFEPPPVDSTGERRSLAEEEARLIYVAVTRAKLHLDTAGFSWIDSYSAALSAGVSPARLAGLPLTGQLRHPSSPVSRFLAAHLGDSGRVARDYLSRLRGLPHPVQPLDVQRPAWTALGHAIDLRLRVSLGGDLGAAVAAGVRAVGSGASGALRVAGEELLARVRGGSGLSDDELARLCFVAGYYEDVFRTGEIRRGSLLHRATDGTLLDDLLRAVPRYAIEDIGAQLALAASPFASFRALPASRRVCGPVFVGSADLGGADADFILDGLLLDCKATTMPARLGRDEINQLAGYLLLDYADAFGIRGVGLYLSRQGAVIDWMVDEFLGLLGARLPLAELRARLRRHLRGGAS